MPGIKILGAVRLSRMTDESTSPVRQRERIEWWAQGHDATVVAITQDLDISGAVDPFRREALGKWLSATPPQPWDVLVACKLDRISRSSMDTETLLLWCLDRGKRIGVGDGIDTQMGQVWVKLASIFAEVERNAIRERGVSRPGRNSGLTARERSAKLRHPPRSDEASGDRHSCDKVVAAPNHAHQLHRFCL